MEVVIRMHSVSMQMDHSGYYLVYKIVGQSWTLCNLTSFYSVHATLALKETATVVRILMNAPTIQICVKMANVSTILVPSAVNVTWDS